MSDIILGDGRKRDGLVLCIAGTRKMDKKHRNTAFAMINDTIKKAGLEVAIVIHGGATGPDKWADEWAREKEIELEVYLPKYEQYGQAAPLKRNCVMAELCDGLMTIWDGHSKGTQHMMEQVVDRDKPVWIFRQAFLAQYIMTKTEHEARTLKETGRTPGGLVLP